jgi:hypothetical protein
VAIALSVEKGVEGCGARFRKALDVASDQAPRCVPNKPSKPGQYPRSSQHLPKILGRSQVNSGDPMKDYVAACPPAFKRVTIGLKVRDYVGRDDAVQLVQSGIAENDVEQDFVLDFGWHSDDSHCFSGAGGGI